MQKQIKFIFLSIFLIIFSAIFNFYVASRGVFHVDTFVHFDSGFRILKGDLPIRDFWIIHGFLIDYIQSLFFYFFGFSWFSYILHSSIFNSAICFFSFYLFFKYLNLGLGWSTFFALLISCLAYPISGSPFLDLHSIFFSLFGIYFIIISIIKDNNKLWFFAPIFFFIGFLCKQVPSFYIGLLATLFCFFHSFKVKKINILFSYILGGVSAVLLFLVFLTFQNIDLKLFFLQFIQFPSSVGGSRYSDYSININNFFFNLKFLHFFLMVLISIITINIINTKNYLASKDMSIFLILLLFVTGSIFHQIYTKNQIFIFFLIPLITGFTFYFQRNLNFKKNKFFKLFLAFFCLIICLKYINRFDIERKFHELSNVDLSKAVNFSVFDQKFKGLKWISPSFKNPEKEINLLKVMRENLLKNENRNKMLISEYNFFSFSLNKNYYGLSRTYDEISFPNKESKYFDNYRLFFKAKIKNKKINEIFFLDSTEIDKLRLNQVIFNFIPENCFDKIFINQFIVKLNVKNCEFLE